MARGNAAVRASLEGGVNALALLQARAFDASMFITYMQARLEHNNAVEAFLFGSGGKAMTRKGRETYRGFSLREAPPLWPSAPARPSRLKTTF